MTKLDELIEQYASACWTHDISKFPPSVIRQHFTEFADEVSKLREHDSARDVLRRVKAYGKSHTTDAGVTGSLLEFKSGDWFFIRDKVFD